MSMTKVSELVQKIEKVMDEYLAGCRNTEARTWAIALCSGTTSKDRGHKLLIGGTLPTGPECLHRKSRHSQKSGPSARKKARCGVLGSQADGSVTYSTSENAGDSLCPRTSAQPRAGWARLTRERGIFPKPFQGRMRAGCGTLAKSS